jgi:3-phenylpropionate/trans-cinnamate dioxygenase ferredoxin reductase subunit
VEVINIECHQQGYLIQIRDVQTKQVTQLTVDAVVAGIGIRPNVELARKAGLNVADGIRVDAALRTNRVNIYAAGDVAEFFNSALKICERNMKTMPTP